jgi:hypothetical protein
MGWAMLDIGLAGLGLGWSMARAGLVLLWTRLGGLAMGLTGANWPWAEIATGWAGQGYPSPGL